MKDREMILKVPGAEFRYGYIEKELPFDNMVRFRVLAEDDRNGKRKCLKPSQQYWYLAHKEHISTNLVV